MESNRLIDYFCIYGVHEKLSSIKLAYSNKGFSSLEDSCFNSVSSLRLLVTQANEIPSSSSEFIKFHHIGTAEDRSLWLETIYGRINGTQRKDWKGKSIKSIGLFFLKESPEGIMVPVSHDLDPVPVSCSSGYSHSDSQHRYFSGNYDLSAFIKATGKEGYSLVMAVAYAGKGEPSIQDLAVVKAQKEAGKKVVSVPEGFEYLPSGLGPEKDFYLCFKNQPRADTIVFKPGLIDRYPRKDFKDTAVSLFVFGEGVRISKAQEPPKAFSFALTTFDEANNTTSRLYVTAMVFYEKLSEELSRYLCIPSNWYLPKAICIVSHWQFLDEFREVLKELYRISLSNYSVPIERVICNLVDEVPLPDEGLTAVEYKIADKKIHFSRPPPKNPWMTSHISLEFLFRSLPLEHIVTLWSCIMLEKKILLVSTKRSLLQHAAVALEGLLFPFKWQHVFIPVLPGPLKSYVETIFPYIIGVHPKLLDEDTEIPVDAAKANLDTGSLEILDPVPRVPEKLTRTLMNRLKDSAVLFSEADSFRDSADYAYSYNLEDMDTTPVSVFNPYAVRDAFLELQTSLLKNYQRFFKLPESYSFSSSAIHFFNTSAFLSYHKALKPYHFLYKVTETSLFANFVERRFTASTQKYDLVYFDEAMKFKRTKVDPFFVKPFYPKEVLPVWQFNEANIEPCSTFSYQKFPSFDSNYIAEPRPIKQLTAHKVFQCSLYFKDENLVRMTQSEWAKYLLVNIYKVWFQLFALSIPMHKEKGSSMLELALSVMEDMKKKAERPDQEIYRKLIEACGKCGHKEKVLSLFKRMKNQGIEPDALTHGVYMTSVARAQNPSEAFKSFWGTVDVESCFYSTEDLCPFCENTVTFMEIMMGWERSFSSYTTTCPFEDCGKKFVAKFGVTCDNQETKVEVVSPPIVRKELENLIYSSGEDILLEGNFPNKHSILFWNVCLYFDLVKLPKFFVNPFFSQEELESYLQNFTNSKRGSVSPTTKKALSRSFELLDEAETSSGSESTWKWKNIFGRWSDSTKGRNPSIQKVFGSFVEDLRYYNILKAMQMHEEDIEDSPDVNTNNV